MRRQTVGADPKGEWSAPTLRVNESAEGRRRPALRATESAEPSVGRADPEANESADGRRQP